MLLGAVLLLGACGGDDGEVASSSTVTTETTTTERSAAPTTADTDSTETTVVPEDTYTDDERRKVKAIYKAYLAEYGELIELVEPGETSLDDANLDKQIVDSCQTKAKGFTSTPDEISMVTMLFGAKLQERGLDVSTFVEDSLEASKKIADVVEC